MGRDVHVLADKELLDRAKEVFPETKGLTYSSLVDYLIRKVLKEAEG